MAVNAFMPHRDFPFSLLGIKFVPGFRDFGGLSSIFARLKIYLQKFLEG